MKKLARLAIAALFGAVGLAGAFFTPSSVEGSQFFCCGNPRCGCADAPAGYYLCWFSCTCAGTECQSQTCQYCTI